MRLLIEKSRAVKSPSVGHQLVGSKKVQQVLTREGVIEKYISDSKVANEIRSTFVNLYSLDMVSFIFKLFKKMSFFKTRSRISGTVVKATGNVEAINVRRH